MKPFRKMTWAGFASTTHGKLVAPDKLPRIREEDRQLNATNAAAVRTLEAAGIPCHRPHGDRIVTTHGISDADTEIEQWRNINLLPVVHVRRRRIDVVVLEGYCSRFSWGLRMRLITSGARCRVEEVGARIDFLHETVRRLRERKWFYSVAELISAGIEFTTEPGPDGHLLFHVHTHLIYRILRPVSKAEFRDFLRRWKGHFKGRHCPDSGHIRDLREACKYPCKAADLLGVINAGELPELYHQLEGRKLFQTYGGLRALRANLRATREKMKRRLLDSPAPEAVTQPKAPLVEYVRVAPQPPTRVHYHERRYQDEPPTNIFLGWTHPAIDKKTGQIAVQEVWLNPTLSPEERRKLRNITRWTPALWSHLNGTDEPPLHVHTYTSSACFPGPEDALPPEGEVSPFVGQDGHDAEDSPPPDEPDFDPEHLGISVLEVEPEDLQNRYI